MIELGSGIALAGLCISGGAVSITAIRTFFNPTKNGKHEIPDHANFQCKEHSGIVQGIENIEKGQDRHEKWLSEISTDVKSLLKR